MEKTVRLDGYNTLVLYEEEGKISIAKIRSCDCPSCSGLPDQKTYILKEFPKNNLRNLLELLKMV